MSFFGLFGRKARVGDVWRCVFKKANPFEGEEFVDRTVLEIRGKFVKVSKRYHNGLEPPNPEVVEMSYLTEFSTLLNP